MSCDSRNLARMFLLNSVELSRPHYRRRNRVSRDGENFGGGECISVRSMYDSGTVCTALSMRVITDSKHCAAAVQ